MSGRKVYIDDWDKPISSRAWHKHERKCDLKENVSIHRKGDMYFISLFKRTNSGYLLDDIKREEHVSHFTKAAVMFLNRFIGSLDGWCILTAPKRRHFEGFHFSTSVCREIAKSGNIPFYENAFQCITKDRVNPDIHLLRKINENRVIVFDDILTTGSTIAACYQQIKEKNQVIVLIGINNN